MKKLILALGLVLFLLPACDKQDADTRKTNPAPKATPLPVTLAPALKQDWPRMLALNAELLPGQRTVLSLRQSGILHAIHVKLGEQVKARQLLAEVSSPDIDARRQQAEAAVEEARARVKQRRLDARLAALQATRDQKLSQADLIARQDAELSAVRAETLAAELTVATAALKRQHGALAEALSAQEALRLYAPYAGTIAEVQQQVGSVTGPNTPLLTLVATRPLLVQIRVPEQDCAMLKVGLEVPFSVDALGTRVLQARLKRLSPVIDSVSRTLTVELEVMDPPENLRPGMFARIRLPLQALKGIWVVPSEAVARRGDAIGVFVARGGVAQFVPATVTRLDTWLSGVSGALRAGDRVVVKGSHLVADQQAIDGDQKPATKRSRTHERDKPEGHHH